MKKIYLLMCLAFGFAFYGASAEAEEYLFSFNGPAVMPLSADSSIEAVNAEHGLYTSSDEEYLKELLNAGVISYYEPMGYAELFDYVPEDKYYGNQRSFMNMIKAPFAWNKDNFGKGVRIAVIDTGLSTKASEFPLEYVTRAYDYVKKTDDPSSKYCEDTDGHGTSVAGIISAEHNTRGIAGISPYAELYIFRCCESGTSAAYRNIIDAIYKAVDEYGCDIINMSLGGDQASESLRKAVDYAYSKGALIVASAGNDGADSGKVYYPAAYDNVICVGSVNASGHTASHSQRNDYVDIMAPGEDVWSVSRDNDGYGKVNGTSFAAPHVTAAAALAKSLNPKLTNKELTNLLYLSADSMIDRYSGHGRLNVQSLLTLCQSSLSPNSLIYSVSGKNTICAVTPSEGFTSFMAVYNGDSVESVYSDRLVVLPSNDFDKLRLFIWKKDTLVPSEAEISKTMY